jgi:hypothetical protein
VHVSTMDKSLIPFFFRLPIKRLFGWASLMLLSSAHGAVLVGPGSAAATSGADSGERLNVSRTNILTTPGFYTVTGASFSGTSASGTLTPFLAWNAGSNTYQSSWAGTGIASANGTVSSSPGTVVYLPGAANHAGFYTSGGGRVGFTSGGITDHDNDFTGPSGANQTVDGFSNAGLGRTYGFGVTLEPLARYTTLSSGFLSTTGVDGGERLNVDESGARTLGPGTYSLRDFSFQGTSASGSVVPVLVTSTGANSYQTIWKGSAVGSAVGMVQVDPSGTFTLGSTATIYPAFFTQAGGRVAHRESIGVTDHASAFTSPQYVGSTLSTFSNPNLSRQYSFGLSVQSLINATRVGPGLVATTGVDSGERLNIDISGAMTLAPGLYSLESFTFNGTSATGSVTPFLARSTGGSGVGQTYEILWQGSAVGSELGTVSADLLDEIFFGTAETVYAGFFTEAGGRVAHNGFGSTEHNNAFGIPTGIGSVLTGWSNPDLARTYAFSLILTVPEPGRGSAILLAAFSLVLVRRRPRR